LWGRPSWIDITYVCRYWCLLLSRTQCLQEYRLGSHRSGQRGSRFPYYISRDQANKIYLPDFLKEPRNPSDPAYKVCTCQTTNGHKLTEIQDFLRRLLCHLLARDLGWVSVGDEPEYSKIQLASVNIQHNTIFAHATARFSYTSYDVRRGCDTIHCDTTHCDIMLRACDDAQHPFWYARVIGIMPTCFSDTNLAVTLRKLTCSMCGGLGVIQTGREDLQSLDWTVLAGFQKMIHRGHLGLLSRLTRRVSSEHAT
jgi:hypothetical protein